MKYVVISPKNKLICFDDAEHVAEYCMEKDNVYLDKYCEEQELEYENMTPVEIGYNYAAVGAEIGGCRIFETIDVLRAMKDEAVEEEMINETRELLDNKRHEQEIECPGYLEDIFSIMTPIPVSSLVGHIYISNNVDGGSSHQVNSGV